MTDPLIGTVVDGKLKILAPIAESGTETVYRAEHLALNKPVAAKIIRAAMTSEAADHFKQDAAAFTGLAHDSLAKILDSGVSPEGLAYIVLDASGDSLMAFVRDASPGTKELLSLFAEICGALQYARSAGLAAPEIKACDVLIEKANGKATVRVLDLGLASSLSAGLTPADELSQLYSLGCVFYEGLTGRAPFEDIGSKSFLDKRLSDAPPDPREFNKSISEPLAAVVTKLLSKQPEKNYRNLNELEADLSALIEGRSLRQRKPVLTGKLALIIALVALPILILCLAMLNVNQLKDRAQTLAQNENWEEAVSAYSALLKTQPDKVDNWTEYTNALLAAHKYSQAVLAAKDGLKVFPKQAMLLARLSNAYYNLGNFKAAETAALDSIKFDSKEFEALITLSWTLEEQNRLNEAIDYARKAADVDPKSIQAFTTLSSLYIKTGRSADAESAAKKGLALDPKNPSLNLNMAKALDAQGRNSDAAKYHQSAGSSSSASQKEGRTVRSTRTKHR
jgi:serine/threonine protein kinase